VTDVTFGHVTSGHVTSDHFRSSMRNGPILGTILRK
jgi:hypothetical protein